VVSDTGLAGQVADSGDGMVDLYGDAVTCPTKTLKRQKNGERNTTLNTERKGRLRRLNGTSKIVNTPTLWLESIQLRFAKWLDSEPRNGIMQTLNVARNHVGNGEQITEKSVLKYDAIDRLESVMR
jgi:hypothetical protein